MYFPSVIVLLFAALVNAELNTIIQLPEACDGGYCVPKHLCPTGRANNVPVLGQNGVIALEVDEDNECGDFMKICCKDSNTISNMTDYKCGISNPQGLVYQVRSNLTYAKYAEFPWTVAIFEITSSSEERELTFAGVGTLIHPKFVVTAAHTLNDSTRYIARFGEWNLESDAEIYPTREIDIQVNCHFPLFGRKFTHEYDIAFAFLKEPVIYTEHIRPICVPSEQEIFVGKRCIAAGWGWDPRTGQSASIMKRMELKVVHRRRCEVLNRRLGIRHPQHRDFMCAVAAGDQNACIKEGGTPLVCQRDDGSYVLAGIALRRLDCEQSDDPAVFVNVTKFADWLHDTPELYDEWRAKKENKTLENGN
ncbi:inactive CLIP domain-containing serine protease A8-like [Anopheles marshallii]|uniref:inactive CLIP domain-containing serine protease A8-like n=1 Tax=Anopheles marshallii TaxID=1521116 RepID=UPI00237B14C5|nr:inactive CLIP domain-containing serine protease A8-like [Anopheles marshallii]